MKKNVYSMKNYLYSKLRLGLLILLLTTSSCENGQDIVNPSPTIELTQQEKESLMHDFSYGLAIALQNEPALRGFLKKESAKQFDGDYDVLYQLNKGIQIGDKGTFSEILAQYGISPEKMTLIEKGFLNLNIKVLGFDTPVEEWDTQSFVPLVAVRSFDEDAATLTAYDGQGEKILLDSQVQPDQLTVVIEESERIRLKSQNTIERDLHKSLSEIIPYNDGVEREGVAGSSLPPDVRPPRDPSVDAWMRGACPRTTPEATNLTRSYLRSILDY